MRKGWERKKLGEICEAVSTGPFGSMLHKADYVDDGIPLVNPINLIDERIVINRAMLISEATKDRLSRYVLKVGDIVVARRGEIGRCAVVGSDEEGWLCGTGSFFIRPLPRTDSQFLAHLLRSPEYREKLEAASTGTTMQNLSNTTLSELLVLFPPFAEQERIVGLLDEAFAGLATAKANAEKNLQNARALFESHLQSVFTQRGKGWVDSSIGAEIRFIDYRGKTPVKTASGVRLITAKNVKMGYLQATPMEFIAAASYKGWMTRGIPQKGDVLFTTEAPLANVAQLDTDEKVAFAQRIIIMQPDAARLDSAFLKYLLLSQPVQQRIRTKGTGATVQGIKASLLKTIEISFPKSLAEQEQFVEKLDGLSEETQRLAGLYERKLAALEALKKSLLHQAFTGEL